MKEKKKIFIKELVVAIIAGLLAFAIYTIYRDYQKEQRAKDNIENSADNNH